LKGGAAWHRISRSLMGLPAAVGRAACPTGRAGDFVGDELNDFAAAGQIYNKAQIIALG
jgi:hypothetical protein